MADSALVTVTSLPQFEELIASNTYVIVDFWAEWCPPCKAIGPFFAKFATQYAVPGQLAFAKVDSDKVPDVASKYSISSLPTFLFLEGGKAEGIDVGAISGPMVKKTADGSKVTMLQGADAKNLTAIVAELGKRAKEKKDSALSFGDEDF
ncbi:thioredoxin-like protein [Thozetella sp. PMI_491]|nr:thioredoxin-like protein [Thozetella sp. PMI_491]